MEQEAPKTHTTAVLIIFGITLVIIIIYAIVVVFMYIYQWGLFKPYTPKVPGNEADLIRPGGDPKPLTAQQQEYNQKLVAQILNCNSAGNNDTGCVA